MRKSKLQNCITKEMLEYEYNLLGSMQKVADKIDVSIDTVYKYMKLFNIRYEKHYVGLYDCNEDIFSEESERSFYLAGFIAADGSLQKRKYSKILKIALSKNDKAHLEKIKLILDSNHPIKDYVVKPSKLVPTINYCSEIQIVSDKIFDDLSIFNIIPKKSLLLKFPEYLVDHELVHHFIRGYFDGDGCITHCGLGKNRSVIQGSINILGTHNMCNMINQIFAEKANTNLCKILFKNNIYRIQYSGNYNIKCLYNFLYKDATIFLDRKRDKFLNYEEVAE